MDTHSFKTYVVLGKMNLKLPFASLKGCAICAYLSRKFELDVVLEPFGSPGTQLKFSLAESAIQLTRRVAFFFTISSTVLQAGSTKRV
jgi:hypothetical protein